MANRYRTTLRPAGFGGIPSGVGWQYVELPTDNLDAHLYPNKPVSRHRYGVIETDRPLTANELDHFSIEEVPS